MSITKKTTDRLGLGKLVVYMRGGHKSTETAECSRVNAVRKYSDILQINGMEAELVKVVFNGTQIYPEKTEMNTTELCAYLPDHPKTQTVRTWVRKGKIPFHKAGSAKNSPTYFKISEIIKWESNGRK